MSVAPGVAAVRPAVVRVLRATGWIATVAGIGLAIPSIAVGGAEGFGAHTKVWVALAAGGIILLLVGVTALLAARRTPGGMIFGLVSCTLLLLVPLLGALLTVAIAIVASQTWPQLREYYGVRRRPA